MMTKNKIVELDQLCKWVKEWKESGSKVVFTNGCFDLLHLGHVDYLEKAAALGDRFIIGVNTDASVREIKGDKRPITDETSRTRLLASFEFVDAVVLFNEQTPENLINHVVPNILVKGDDYKPDEIVGAKTVLDNGGKVETISFVDGYSTSSIIEKIKGL